MYVDMDIYYSTYYSSETLGNNLNIHQQGSS